MMKLCKLFYRNEKDLKDKVRILIDKARILGAENSDIESSIEFLEHREYGLAFDTIITQLHEQNAKIDSDFYALICEIASKMQLEEKDYIFIKELLN
jgi:hypothetical protein